MMGRDYRDVACIVPSDADRVVVDRYTLQRQEFVLMVRHITCGQADVRRERPGVTHTCPAVIGDK